MESRFNKLADDQRRPWLSAVLLKFAFTEFRASTTCASVDIVESLVIVSIFDVLAAHQKIPLQ